MKPSDPARKQHVIVIDPPDPSWVPIRAAPFLFQTSLGTPGPFLLRPAPQKSINEFVQQQVRCHDILSCVVDRDLYCLIIKYPVATPDGDGWASDEVYPYEVRQQYVSPNGSIRSGCENLVAAIESVWDRLVAGFRRAVTRGYCRVFGRIGSPCAVHFTEIPAAVFGQYDVIDWRHGHATSASDHIFDLHVAGAVADSASLKEQPTIPPKTETANLSKLKSGSRADPIINREETGPKPRNEQPILTERTVADSRAYSVEEATDISGIGRSTLYVAIRDKKLPARKCGRRTLILAADLDAWLATLPSAGS